MLHRLTRSQVLSTDLIRDFSRTSSEEMVDWLRALPCVSGRLRKEMDARLHRHRTRFPGEGNAQTAFEWITQSAQDMFDARSVSLWVLDPRRNELVAQATEGRSASPQLIGLRQSMHIGAVGWVARRRKALLLSASLSPCSHPDFEVIRHPGREAIVFPIMFGEHLIGVLDVGTKESGLEYSEEDLQTLSFLVEAAAVCCYLAVQCERVQRIASGLNRGRAAEHAAPYQKAA